jgi:sulfur carrier protein
MSLNTSGYDQTMMIEVNGKPETIAAKTLSGLLIERGIEADARGVAVALNGAVVPRAAWAETALNADDSVEIVHAKQGG